MYTKLMSGDYHSDYMSEPIGDKNPYWRCIHCKISDPEINGKIERHSRDCIYRISKENGLPYPPDDNEQDSDFC